MAILILKVIVIICTAVKLNCSRHTILVIKLNFRKLKETFADFAKPDGDKETPAKTCRDLHAAHPDKPSGEVS